MSCCSLDNSECLPDPGDEWASVVRQVPIDATLSSSAMRDVTRKQTMTDKNTAAMAIQKSNRQLMTHGMDCCRVRSTSSWLTNSVTSIISGIFQVSTMMAEAVVQHSDNRSLDIAVIIYRTTGRSSPYRPNHQGRVVGGSITSKTVMPGKLSVKLVSRYFEADTDNGEERSLVKTETFQGRDFEKQYACRYTTVPVREGVFGKVIVERVLEDGNREIIFDFNLTKRRENDTACSVDVLQSRYMYDRWSSQPPILLADRLHITESDNWKLVARHLRIPEQEVKNLMGQQAKGQRSDRTCDPLTALMEAYRARAGTYDEFVAALYEASRHLSFGSDLKATEDGDMRSISQQNSFISTTSETSVAFEESDDDWDSSTVHLIDSTSDPPPFLSSPLPLTPPSTPRKRKQSCSDSVSPWKCSPIKRLRSSPSSDSGVFRFDDVSQRVCDRELTDSIVWQVSTHVNNKWKAVGRALKIEEVELMCIEHAHSKDLRECTFQMLLRWKDMFPSRFTYGSLYTALCEAGLKSQARKYLTVQE